VLGMCAIAILKSCAVGVGRRLVCIEARTSARSVIISSVKSVERFHDSLKPTYTPRYAL
jgi:hypothetical protein